MKNILLTIAYDGTEFCGWQRQPGQRSVQGEVERALSQVCGQPIQIHGTSRTDAGVHALGQRASFAADFRIPVEKIPVAVNGLLAVTEKSRGRNHGGDVALLDAVEMPEDFHARFAAAGKKYTYQIRNSSSPEPFLRNYRYHIYKTLNVKAMKQAAAFVAGTHDFKCFQAAGGKVMESTVRTVYGIRVSATGDSGVTSDSWSAVDFKSSAAEGCDIRLEIIGDGFLYNMVRIIAGTLVDVGLGRKQPYEIRDIIEGKDRRRAGHTAPPQGLYLTEIFFEKDRLLEAAAALETQED
ncbi:MAG: truA [Bacillota bacterium]|jgi:tRNA pseudouridine38-40 synthase|nr:truA [Bacillota bacterium]